VGGLAINRYVASSQAVTPPSFVNWESPHVHPLDVTPDGAKLLAVNTADNRLEVYDVSTGGMVSLGSVFVGLDPVSVRPRTNSEVWVVNRISDSISVVNLTTMSVVATLNACDEPADVVFAGRPQRAFVSCGQASQVLVYTPTNLTLAPTVLDIAGEEPRALAVNSDRTKVYVGIFESGNKSTIIGHSGNVEGPRNPVNDVTGPYGGQNPPPNDGVNFKPPINPSNPVAPPANLIVQKDAAGRWMDDNGGDWTLFVSGGGTQSRRPIGWDVLDNDVAVIDAATLGITYFTGMMNLVMSVAVQPGTGKVTTIGTNATNVIRFEPNLKGRFIRVNLALGDPANPNLPSIVDLNPHLDYSDAQVAQQSDPATVDQALRTQSIGDPRGIAWNRNGTQGFVAGMGSNNVLVIDSNGARIGAPIPVGEGPTGVALHPRRSFLYVLNKFEGSISVVNTKTRLEVSRVAFFDPTPQSIKLGRKFQYGTHLTSGLGHIACASCHIDTRGDRLAWDLGDPAGEMRLMNQNCEAGVRDRCPDWHPMKGPMVTQILTDIINREPLHWRGDRNGIEEFNGAFVGLQGNDRELTAEEMQQYKDFLASLFIEPNPFRNFDNSLPTNLPLVNHFSNGEHAGQGGLLPGQPLPNGNAVVGLEGFRTRAAHNAGGIADRPCVSCHTLPTGMGTDSAFVGDTTSFPAPGSGVYQPITVGPNGEHHLQVTGLNLGGQPRKTFKIPQLRNMYKKVGFERNLAVSRSGFGFFNSGTESLADFMAQFEKFPDLDQEIADVIAFLLSFAGSELPAEDPNNLLEPPGTFGQDTHAAVGAQVTVTAANQNDPAITGRLADMAALADAGKVGLIAKGRRAGVQRGWFYQGAGVFQSDKAAETATTDGLRLGSVAGAETTFTVVPKGTEIRMGVDRDNDGVFDGDQVQALQASGAITAFASSTRLVALPSSGSTTLRRTRSAH
jgi:YVTN family beta-propeller protein